MGTIGLADAYKYGTTFLGYLAVVVGAGGVLASGGVYLLDSAGASGIAAAVSADPARAGGGALLLLLGGATALTGLIGLAHKFIADALSVALAETDPVAKVSADPSKTDESADDVDEKSADESDDSSAGQSQPPGEPRSTTADERSDPETRTVVDAPVEGSGARPANERAPGDEQTEGSSSPTAEAAQSPTSSTRTPETTDGVGQREMRTPEETAEHSYQTSAAEADDWTQSEYVTGMSPTGVDDGSENATEPSEGGAAEAFGTGPTETDDSTATKTADRQAEDEWTPPDPSEFEQPGRGTAAEEDGATLDDTTGTDVDGSPSAGESADSLVGDDAVVDDGQNEPLREEGADAFATDDATTEASGVDADQGTDRDTVAFADDPSDDPAAADETDVDEDVTLADEGITSFETKSGDDPLADRLPGDDS